MTLDPFRPEPSGLPDRRIRIAQAEALASELADLLIRNSPAVAEIRQIARVDATYEKYEKVIRRARNALHSRPKSFKFFAGLYDEYLQYDTAILRDVWVKAVGYIVEHTFYLLMLSKYHGTSARVLSECTVLFPSPPCEATTGKKPVDVIAWFDVEKCGEFIEVKKNLETQRGEKFGSKIQVMYQFAKDLSNHSVGKSFIGIATLAPSPSAERLIKSILVDGGYMQSSDQMSDIVPNFLILKTDNLSDWYAALVV